MDLLRRALCTEPHLPTVLGPLIPLHGGPPGLLGARSGDNADAAIGQRRRTGDVVVSFGTSGVVSAGPGHRPRTRAARSPASATPPGTSCRWRAHSTRPGSWTWPPGCSASTMMHCPAWRCHVRWCRRPGRRALSGGERARPAARHPCGARAAAGDLDAGAPVQGGGRGRAVRSGVWARRPGRPGGPGRAGAAHRRGARSVAVRQRAPSLFGCPVLVPPPGESRRPRRGPAAGVGAQRWRGAPRLGARRAPRRSTPIR